MPDPDAVYLGNSKTNTGTAVPKAGGDNHIPIQGSVANWGAITSENFLAGPKPGQEQSLLKVGNQTSKVSDGQRLEETQKKLWHHVYDEDDVIEFDQNRQTTVIKNDTLTVGVDQKIIVMNDQTVSVTNKRGVDAREIFEYGKKSVTIQAGVELILQGPGGFIKINDSGVTIQGSLVKIN